MARCVRQKPTSDSKTRRYRNHRGRRFFFQSGEAGGAIRLFLSVSTRRSLSSATRASPAPCTSCRICAVEGAVVFGGLSRGGEGRVRRGGGGNFFFRAGRVARPFGRIAKTTRHSRDGPEQDGREDRAVEGVLWGGKLRVLHGGRWVSVAAAEAAGSQHRRGRAQTATCDAPAGKSARSSAASCRCR